MKICARAIIRVRYGDIIQIVDFIFVSGISPCYTVLLFDNNILEIRHQT